MRNLLADKEYVYHLQEYAILENEEGTYEYVAWQAKGEKLSWMRGEATILEDICCLRNITSEGEEETMETLFEVKVELHQLSKWDKTSYYCAVIGKQAALIKYCDTGEVLKPDGEEYGMVKEMLKKHGLTLQ